MSIVRFLETFIFRDILSYLVPGIINLFAVFIIKSDINVISFYQTYFEKVHIILSLFVIFALSYTLGYFGSTSMFILRSKIVLLNRPKVEPPLEGVLSKMVEVFGDWITQVNKENSKMLVPFCLNYVQVNTPDIYFEKIERRVTLRNFEVGLSFTSLLYLVVIAIVMDGYDKLYALIPMLTLIVFLYGSRYTDGEIDRFSFRLFLNSFLNTQRQAKET